MDGVVEIMAISDILSGVGKGLATAGRVAGAVAEPVAKAVVNEEAGYAPQIAAEKRRHQEQLEDAQINAKATELESQLAMGQKYGTLTPAQHQQYVDAITQLYSQPRHAPLLMEKLRKAIHPNGAVSQGITAPLKDATPAGGTEEANQREAIGLEDQKASEARRQAGVTADYLVSQLPPNTPPEQKVAFRNNALDHLLKASTGKETPPKGMKAISGPGGAFVGIVDQDTGKQYLPEQLGPGGDAPTEAKSMFVAVQKAEKDKLDASEKKQQAHDAELEKRQDKSESNMERRQERSEAFQESMLGKREQEQQYATLDKAANNSQSLVDTYQSQYAQPGNHSATDTALVADYTSVLAKGGRKTQAELQMARDIGSFKLNAEQKAKKIYTGELPNELRKMYLDYMAAAAKTQRNDAENIKPEGQGNTGARKVNTSMPSTGARSSSKGVVSLAKARNLPQYKGKSDADITEAAKALGYQVKP